MAEDVVALRAIAELARIDFAQHDLDGVLDRIAHVARRALVDGGEVSFTLLRGAVPFTAAFTGEPARALDETQYDVGNGPCLSAAAAGESMVIADMAVESRWPAFATAAVAAGIHSSVALVLPVQDGVTGALNVYSPKTDAFDAAVLELGRTFAAYAAVAVGNARLYDDAAAQARQLQEAMTHRSVIEQAKGIVMGDRRCSAQEAFEILRQLSNTTNRKLREVAEVLVAEATRTPEPR